MKLHIAMVVSFILCGSSLVARASIVHRLALSQAAQAAQLHAAAIRTPAQTSERLALSGLDSRIGSRLHRLAHH